MLEFEWLYFVEFSITILPWRVFLYDPETFRMLNKYAYTCVVFCFVVLCFVVLCFVVFCCVVLCFVVFRFVELCFVVLCCFL